MNIIEWRGGVGWGGGQVGQMRRWRGGRGSGGRAKGSGVIEGKRKRTEDGHRKIERERESK